MWFISFLIQSAISICVIRFISFFVSSEILYGIYQFFFSSEFLHGIYHFFQPGISIWIYQLFLARNFFTGFILFFSPEFLYMIYQFPYSVQNSYMLFIFLFQTGVSICDLSVFFLSPRFLCTHILSAYDF